ncbi:MAG: probable conjugal transfer protein (TraB) [Leptospirillum rubarum]|nr:MAG: probable conjugal transfer protein (TraB) [Leptospirillum rubarum]
MLSPLFLVPVLGLAFPPISSWLFFLAYYLSAIYSIQEFYHIFYAQSSILPGLFVWLAYGLCLSIPWAIARLLRVSKGLQLLSGTLPALFPPLYFLGAVSPLFSAGILFPGTGLFGIPLLLILQVLTLRLVTSSFDTRSRSDVFFGVSVLVGISLILNLSAPTPSPPIGWTAIDTIGQPRSLIRRTSWEIRLAKEVLHRLNQGDRVILLPEGVAEFWSGPALPFPWSAVEQTARLHHATVLVGSEIPVGSVGRVWDDALVQLGKERRNYPARQPIPLAGWNPFSKSHHERSHWFRTGVYRIEDRRAEVSICFEDILIGPHFWGTLLGHPDMIVSADNLWFSKGTSDRSIQSVSVRSFGRLLEIPVLRAVNQ